jgi:hypothetical protein
VGHRPGEHRGLRQEATCKGRVKEIARLVRNGQIVGPNAALIMLEQAIAEEGVRAAAPRRPVAGPSDEYGTLFPTPAEMADRQAAAAMQRAVSAAALSDDELRDHLFGDRTFADHHGAGAAAAPGHIQFVGTHSHNHAAYQQGDSGTRHTHAHTHSDDANHDHH